MQYNSQRFNGKPKEVKTGGEIEQYFGNGNLFEQQQLSGASKPVSKSKVPKKVPFAILSIIDKVPIEKNRGYLSFMILLVILLISLIFLHEWNQAFSSVLLGIVTFIAWRKVPFKMNADFLHYLSNATVTWKALIKQISLLKSLLDYSRHILLGCIFALWIQTLLLNPVFPSSVTSFIHSASFFGVFVGLTLCFGNREFTFMYQSLTLYGFLLMIEVILNVILYGYMYVLSGFTFLVIWTMASYLKEWDAMERESEKVKSTNDNISGN